VEELPAVTEVGLRLAVGPAGETPALKFTVAAEPLVTAVLIVDVPLLRPGRRDHRRQPASLRDEEDRFARCGQRKYGSNPVVSQTRWISATG
jgi:hypothetical protein